MTEISGDHFAGARQQSDGSKHLALSQNGTANEFVNGTATLQNAGRSYAAINPVRCGCEGQGENMKKIVLGMATAMVVAASPACAAPLLFNFSGPSGTAMFQLDSNPTPATSQTFLGSDQFSFSNVAGTYGGIAGTASTISFGNGIFASFNVNAPNLGFTQFNAPTLFTGSPSKPTFLTGNFTLVNPFFGNGTLSISPVASAVPEPATWAMMLLGFAGIGFAMRRRAKVRTTVTYA